MSIDMQKGEYIKDLNVASITGRVFCEHKHIVEIGYTGNLGDNSRFYDGFCCDCQQTVYAQTGKKVIFWTTDRNKAWT